MTRSVCIHGHFYQPPRENPWTGKIDRQASAAPYRDWNKRIHAECYARNAKAPILKSNGVVERYNNNYECISFDFGPTLLQWSEREEPALLKVLREAEKKSAYYNEGHGNGIAQAYHHLILPLAHPDDREIEIQWGLSEFERRFGRIPKGLWLPETGVDIPTLEALVDAGVEFTILAPSQIAAVKKPGGEYQQISDSSELSQSRPFLVDLPSGRHISVFAYDGRISHGIAFGGLLDDGRRFAESIVDRFDESDSEAQMVLVATDGESYGHHHRYGEMALAKCIAELNANPEVVVENCESFLRRCPPTWKAKIHEPSAWSCAHGVGRWKEDCGCAINPNSSWNQEWRGPLRDSLNWLREELFAAIEKSSLKFSQGLHAAQLDYVQVVLNASSAKDFVKKHCPASTDDVEGIIEIMEMLKKARAMFTSCAWFFDDISGIEARQNLLYARRAMEIAGDRLGVKLEKDFTKRLKAAKSNLEEWVDGEVIYRNTIAEAQGEESNLPTPAVDTGTAGILGDRSAGVLMHPTSFANQSGIGTLGIEAYRFIDWLFDAGFKWWQILPLVPPAMGGSPYSSWSTFAANPLLICLNQLEAEGLLEALVEESDGSDQVDFDKVQARKLPLLEKAGASLLANPEHPWFEGLQDFRKQASWLEDTALFYAIKKSRNGESWWTWPKGLKSRDPQALRNARKELAHEMDVFVAIQYFFERQWNSLKRYCEQKGVRIMGDIPIYVAHDSADVWANQELFFLDDDGRCIDVAGAPPDAYSDTGQLWGNPIYRWNLMEKNDFAWWKQRIGRALEQVDLVRLDHFRGFAAYWSVAGKEDTALNGNWVPGPGARFFDAIRTAWPELPFVAEDLGLIDDDVVELRDQFELPGMRVLQFGFDDNPNNIHAVHNVVPNSVVYTGTHDSDTLLGWWNTESDWLKDQVRRYFGVDGHDVVWDLIRACFSSVGTVAVVQMQDLLALDSEGRMNRPGIADGNWGWRLKQEASAYGAQNRTRDLLRMYGRT